MRRLTLLASLLAIPLSLVVAAQNAPLTVLEAAPAGRLGQLSEANEIRIIFSEPMVALGRVPSNPAIPWVTISPRLPGAFRWSGTTILIYTPDPATPVPYATTFTVTVGAEATSASGRRLATPHRFEFTTPTVQLLSARWYRAGGRADQSAVIALKFNQPVDPPSIASHLTARYKPHEWVAPVFGDRELARFRANDPGGLAAFNAKMAAIRRVAASSGAIRLRVAADWNKERFPAAPDLVVVETIDAPSPEGWIELTLDASAPSPAGRAVRGEPTQTVVQLEPAFFVRPMACKVDCAPSDWNPVEFSGDVSREGFAAALGILDITAAAAGRAVAKQPARSPARENDWRTGFNVEDADFERQGPVTTWRLRLDPSLRARDGQTLGYPWIAVVENARETAFVSFGDGHGVWERSGGSVIPFSARNFASVRQAITPLTVDTLMPKVRELQPGFRVELGAQGAERRLNVTPDAIQSHGLDLSSALSAGGTGLAVAVVEPGETIPRATTNQTKGRATIVQSTNLGISVKDSPQNTLVFVTRLDNGAPVPSASVSIVGLDNRRLWQGPTNADGIAMAPALPLRSADDAMSFSFIVTAEKDGDVAYVGSDWNEGIEPWHFDVSYGIHEAAPLLRGSVFTDRGVYKPGEEVHFKIIVRSDTPNGVRLLPAGTNLIVRTHDARDRLVNERTVAVNSWSSAEWTWTVPESATLGNFRVEAEWPSRPAGQAAQNSADENRSWLRTIHGQFLVAAYRKPDFRVDTTLVTDAPIAGAMLRATSTAQYLFGSPLANRPIRWTVTRDADTGAPAAILERFPTFTFGQGEHEYRESAAVAGNTATTDARGQFSAEVASESPSDRAYRYTFESEVTDVSRYQIAGRTSLVVHPASFYVGLALGERFVAANQPAEIRLVAANLQGQPVSGANVTLTLMRVQWNSVRAAQGDGFYEWRTERTETAAGTVSSTTGADPVAVRIPVGEGGSYVLRATARDAAGRATTTELQFYALGSGYTAWERFDHNRITLTPERQTWKPGDRARILIQSPWESGTALLTVEREGIRRHERFALTSTQQTVEVPIGEDDIPNVYVSVLLIRGRSSNEFGRDGSDPGKPAFRLGYTELKVADTSKSLNVAVSADRQEYRPANNARVTVKVTDAAARPVVGEVTLWAVDYGILSLTGYEAPDVLKAVYEEKVLQVMTADSRQRVISRRVLTPKGDDAGGGGGLEGARQDFRPLAFWIGSVVTGADGTTTTDVRLPESLTTYRILGVAGDAASRFGSGLADIKVSKPVTMLAAFPRFLSLGDTSTFGAVVTNTLTTGGPARVTIRSLDAAALEIVGASTQTVTLGPGESANVRFNAVARRVGTPRVQMTVTLGENSDAFEAPLPVTAVTRLETSAAFGETTDRSTQPFALPAGVLPMAGGLTIDWASTALVGLSTGARYVVDYPYGCAEQKTSAALTFLLAADLGAAFSLGEVNPSDYRARATQLLMELPRFQCGGGGFSLWTSPCMPNPYLTAYMLHVMKIAGDLGIAPDRSVVDPALDFLEKQLAEPAPLQVQWLPVWGASQAYGVKVLAEYGRNQDSNITRLVSMADRLPVFALSNLLDALAAANDRGPRYTGTLARVMNALRVEGDQTHVQELNEDALEWLWHSNERSTAIVLSGLVRRGDTSPSVPGLVRWLNGARREGHWGSTQSNAAVLEAMVRYYRAFESEVPNMAATATLGDRALGTARFQGRSTTAQQIRLAMPDLLRVANAGATETLAIGKTGAGRLYYSTRVQYAPEQPLPALDQGIRIERHYEPFVENSPAQAAATTFGAGDLVRVVLRVTLPQERRYVAIHDPVPAGFEPVEGWFRTTASDLAAQSQRSSDDDGAWWERWQRGGFDHVERHDDRVLLFGTRLGNGTHEYSYLVRATTSGTFTAPGVWAEEMYAPEVNGRSGPARIVIR
jgi:uncharacterized protein YfaS (alpha-2-macroglobulin family)